MNPLNSMVYDLEFPVLKNTVNSNINLQKNIETFNIVDEKIAIVRSLSSKELTIPNTIDSLQARVVKNQKQNVYALNRFQKLFPQSNKKVEDILQEIIEFKFHLEKSITIINKMINLQGHKRVDAILTDNQINCFLQNFLNNKKFFTDPTNGIDQNKLSIKLAKFINFCFVNKHNLNEWTIFNLVDNALVKVDHLKQIIYKIVKSSDILHKLKNFQTKTFLSTSQINENNSIQKSNNIYLYYLNENVKYLKYYFYQYNVNKLFLDLPNRLNFFREIQQFFIQCHALNQISLFDDITKDLIFFINHYHGYLLEEEKEIIYYFLCNGLIHDRLHTLVILQLNHLLSWHFKNFVQSQNGKISEEEFRFCLVIANSMNLNCNDELPYLVRKLLIDHISSEEKLDFVFYTNLNCLLNINELYNIGYYKFINYVKSIVNKKKILNLEEFATLIKFICGLVYIQTKDKYIFTAFFQLHRLILNDVPMTNIQFKQVSQNLKSLLDGQVLFGKMKAEIALIIKIGHNKSNNY